MPYDAIDLGQHWPSNALQLQVITRTNADFSLVRFWGIELRANLHQGPMLLFCIFISLQNYALEIISISPRGQCVNSLRPSDAYMYMHQ